MSAIYGILSNDAELHNKFDYHLKAFDQYTFDRVSMNRYNRAQFACFHQEVTNEAKSEVLPYIDVDRECIITADAIIDNRDELIKLLSIESQSITDSQLILEAYHKWGNESPKYLIGSYAYCIYNNLSDEIILVRDKVGSRIIYYRFDEIEFSFSTIMNSLLRSNQRRNDNYIKKFLAVKTVMHDFHPSETICQGINILQSGHMILVKNGQIDVQCYWSLKDKKRKPQKSVDETRKEFKRIYDEAIKCRLRSAGEVGINLSGGYDSSSIACVAADHLALSGKQLYAYTAVASKDFDMDIPANMSGDESDLVMKIVEMYPNIKANITDFSSITPLNTMRDIMKTLEQPFKFNVNAYWVYKTYELASIDNCRIFLTGQYGNNTFSFSDLDKYYFYLLKSFRFKKFYKEFSRNCKHFKISRKDTFVKLIKSICLTEKKDTENSLRKYVKLTKSETAELMDYLDEDILVYSPRKSIRDVIEYALDPATVNHIAAAETKFGLKHNVVMRDPTKDVRLLEFLHNLTIVDFNYNGFTKTLATSYMKDIVPESIICSTVKGLQSADYLHRINNEWSDFFKELTNELSKCDEIGKYLDIENLKLDLSDYETLKLDYDGDYIAHIAELVILSCSVKYLSSSQIS